MIVVLDDGDRAWLRVAADAIRSTARRNGLRVPALAGELELLACVRPTETIPPGAASAADSAGMPLLYRRDEVAQLLAVSPRTVDRLLAAGELRAIKVANDRRIARDDVVAFVEKQRAAGCDTERAS